MERNIKSGEPVIKLVKITEVKPNKDNPRTINDDKFKKLIKSIKEFPKMLEIRPIVVDDDMVVLGGNMRLKACKEAGLGQVHIIKAEHLTEEQKKEFIIKDNVGFGEWDWEALNNEWDTDDLEEWGLDLPEFFEEEEEETEEEETEGDNEILEDVAKESVMGDLWEIGEHRVICGDSTSSSTLDQLLQEEKATLVFTDPPYGMKKEADGILNDNLNFKDLLKFNKEWIPLTFTYMKPNGSWYCWGINEPLMDIYYCILKPMIQAKKAVFRNLITWNKSNGQGQNSSLTRSYATADEKCLFMALGNMGETINGEDYNGEYDPVLNYLQSEEKQSGLSKIEMKAILGDNMYSHYMTASQFSLISESKYEELQERTNLFSKPYLKLKDLFMECKEKIRAKQFYFNNTHDNMNNVWHFDRTGTEERENTGGHASPKPIVLCERGIKSSSKENDIVLDVFGGSGSTLIACEKIGRKARLIELDPKYCDVIVKRYIDFCRKNNRPFTVKLNGEEYKGELLNE